MAQRGGRNVGEQLLAAVTVHFPIRAHAAIEGMQHAVIGTGIDHVTTIIPLGGHVLGVAAADRTRQTAETIVVQGRAQHRRGGDDVAQHGGAVTQLAAIALLVAAW
ncbi:hypothetical protein G6F32_016483 [Rhizopus arrhizus]|nr:hypothetical protein G6F32_016483 [Rhizopus arrhizus]